MAPKDAQQQGLLAAINAARQTGTAAIPCRGRVE